MVERGTETRFARATYYVLIKGAATGAARAGVIITRYYRKFPDIAGFFRILPDISGHFRTFPGPVITRNNHRTRLCPPFHPHVRSDNLCSKRFFPVSAGILVG